jgi:hypothetical protein
MTKDLLIQLIDNAIENGWESDCQYPYTCQEDCYCQRMREGAKQNVTVEEKGDVK